MKTIVDIGEGDIDIYVGDQLILYIGQVSDDHIVNLFLYPEGNLLKSLISEENPDSKCTHEILATRKKPR